MSIRGARPRRRCVVTGTVSAVRAREQPGPIFEADLDDGTGVVTLVFLGRRAVPGIEAGCRLTAEATLLVASHRRELLNPLYRFEPDDER